MLEGKSEQHLCSEFYDNVQNEYNKKKTCTKFLIQQHKGFLRQRNQPSMFLLSVPFSNCKNAMKAYAKLTK